jgi:hypothetical protein
MREGSQGPPDSPLTLTILIDRQEAYEFMLQCEGRATVGGIVTALQKTYDGGIKNRAIFRDRECSVQARLDESALETGRLFLDFT